MMGKRIVLILAVVVVGVLIAQAAGLDVLGLAKGFVTFLGDLFEPGKRY